MLGIFHSLYLGFRNFAFAIDAKIGVGRRALIRVAVLAVVAAPIIHSNSTWASEGRRVALVVGNAAYREAPLRNPVNDARAVAAVLREQGFDVLLRENASKAVMESAFADFGEKLTEGATALFFFAGHGMQVGGRNYLIPVDAKISSELRVRLETLDVDLVLDQMSGARAKVSIAILDACRNNPFTRRLRSVGDGLAQINAPEGTLIAYATAPGKVAADGEGSNGLYTEELLKMLRQPGQKVEDVFKQVRVAVSRRSNGSQTPWEASSLVGDFYFVPPAPVTPVVPATAATPTATNTAEVEFWNSVKSTRSSDELKAYLSKYPRGEFSPIAQLRLQALERETEQTKQQNAADESRERAAREAVERRLHEVEARMAEERRAREEAQQRTRELQDAAAGAASQAKQQSAANESRAREVLEAAERRLHEVEVRMAEERRAREEAEKRAREQQVAAAGAGSQAKQQSAASESRARETRDAADRRAQEEAQQRAQSQVAALPKPGQSLVSKFDGQYMVEVKGFIAPRVGLQTMTLILKVQGDILSGNSSGGSRVSCAIDGVLDAESGKIVRMGLGCGEVNASLTGGFSVKEDQKPELLTEMRVTMGGGSYNLRWKPYK